MDNDDKRIDEKAASLQMPADWSQFINDIEAVIATKRRRMTWARAAYYAWTMALMAAVLSLFFIMDEQKKQVVSQRKQLESIIKNERMERKRQVEKAELEIREAKRIALEEVGKLSSEAFLRDLGVQKSFADYEERLEAAKAQLRTELDKKVNRTELMAELEKRDCKTENCPNPSPHEIYPAATRGIYPLPGR